MRLGSDEKNCEGYSQSYCPHELLYLCCFADINECIEVFGVCDQICTNVKGSYRCDCHRGFTLEPDGHTCKLNEGYGYNRN